MGRNVLLICCFAGLLSVHPVAAQSQGPTSPDGSSQPSGSDSGTKVVDDDGKQEREKFYELLMVLADTIDQVDRNYVEKVSRQELLDAAINGILKKLDPYSNYIAPDEIEQFKQEVENEFGGIGIQIATRGNQLRVVSPLVGSPAYRAGMMAGDLILAIDGNSTRDMDIASAIKLMKGRPGTDLTLTVLHPHENESREFSLTREIVKVETVLGDRRRPDDHWDFMYDPAAKIAYVRLTAFSRDTPADLKRAVHEVERDGGRGIILDLRFNPGGLLNAAIEVADMFLTSGLIVSTEGRNLEKQSWNATEPETYKDLKLVVLVNQFSASASEIVAAALQDHDRAIIVGQQTFGKASVQNVIDLDQGRSALKITTGSYQRPSGKPIHRLEGATDWGVKPNDGYEVKLGNQTLARVMEDRRRRDIVPSRHEQGDAGDDDKNKKEESDDGKDVDGSEPVIDPQLERAIEAMREMLRT